MSQKKLYGFAIVVMLLLASSSVVAATRVYWIAADEVDWDYVPSFPINPMSGDGFTPDQRVFVEDSIGRSYQKSVYREYTEGFGALKQRG